MLLTDQALVHTLGHGSSARQRTGHPDVQSANESDPKPRTEGLLTEAAKRIRYNFGTTEAEI